MTLQTPPLALRQNRICAAINHGKVCKWSLGRVGARVWRGGVDLKHARPPLLQQPNINDAGKSMCCSQSTHVVCQTWRGRILQRHAPKTPCLSLKSPSCSIGLASQRFHCALENLRAQHDLAQHLKFKSASCCQAAVFQQTEGCYIWP